MLDAGAPGSFPREAEESEAAEAAEERAEAAEQTGAAAEASEAAEAESQAELLKEATIDEAAARKTALAEVPGGEITKAELEKEDGLLIWSFDIKVEGKEGVDEVHVDAKTGKVVKREHESGGEETR